MASSIAFGDLRWISQFSHFVYRLSSTDLYCSGNNVRHYTWANDLGTKYAKEEEFSFNPSWKLSLTG